METRAESHKDRVNRLGLGSEAPYVVWRRDDGYVNATRYKPGPASEFEILGQFAWDDWVSARALIVAERDKVHELRPRV